MATVLFLVKFLCSCLGINGRVSGCQENSYSSSPEWLEKADRTPTIGPTMKKDLSYHSLSMEDATELALDRPLWRLLDGSKWNYALNWCKPNNEELKMMIMMMMMSGKLLDFSVLDCVQTYMSLFHQNGSRKNQREEKLQKYTTLKSNYYSCLTVKWFETRYLSRRLAWWWCGSLRVFL